MTQIDFEKERQRWDRVAEKYDYEVNAVDQHLAAEIAARLQAHLGSQGTLLEAGCGSGHLSAALARCGYDVSLMDFSEVALTAARRTFEAYKLSAHWYEANLFQLSQAGIPPADCVWNSGVLEHYTTEVMINALREMAAVSGKYVLSVVPNGQSVLYRAFRHWMRRQGRWEWGEENLIESQAAMFEAAGLEVIEESYVGGDFLPYFAQTITQDAEFAGLWADMLAGGVLPANQKYLLLTMGRLASKKKTARKSAAKSANQQLEEKNWTIARLIEALGDREHELLQLHGEHGAGVAEIEALKNQAAELNRDLHLAQQALAQQKDSFEQLLGERERECERRIQELNQALKGAGAERDRALQAQAAARQALAELKISHKKDLKTLSHQLEEASAQRDQWMAEEAAARAQLSSQSSEIANLREQLAMLQQARETLLVNDATLRQAMARQQSEFEEQIGNLTEQIAVATQEQNEALAREVATSEALAGAQAQLEVMQAEIRELQRILDVSRQDLAHAQLQMEALTNLHHELEQVNQRLTGQRDQLAEETQGSQQEIERLRAEAAAAQAELSEASRMLAQAQDERRQSELEYAAKLDHLALQYNELTARYDAAVEEKEKIKQSLSNFTSRLVQIKDASMRSAAEKADESRDLQ